jgi:hypothetical protein
MWFSLAIVQDLASNLMRENMMEAVELFFNEYSRIGFNPKRPRDEHDEAGHRFPFPGVGMDNMKPPRFNVVGGPPIRWVKDRKIKPIFNHGPKPSSKAAMN